jgi:hydrogenase maturation protein HypF
MSNTGETEEWVRARLTITGTVQGVGFRPFVYRLAHEWGLRGYVLNRGDAGVEIEVEGSREAVMGFTHDLKARKPPLARIEGLKVQLMKEADPAYTAFEIRRSVEAKTLRGSTLPPDVAICAECERELRNPTDRRHEYFFITCTDCGPRFTIILRTPYDRPNTTMAEFPMCPECEKEYRNPLNRRFHAQTVACSRCGPQVALLDSRGEPVEDQDPIRLAGRLVEEGHIVAIKGNGGFHVATSTLKPEPILRLRRVKHRQGKPFAIMARSLAAARSFAHISQVEEELLTSYMRPIVLLRKREDYYLAEEIAPGLHNIGVMLPYTGLHLMLFDRVQEPAFVMTSANPPHQPIIKDEVEALRRLGRDVDYFLVHNRRIAHRCDDSVVRVNDRVPALIRRSRGYVPNPLWPPWQIEEDVIALGAELNVTSCIYTDGKAFLSQHIGDMGELETLRFLEEATGHLIDLVNARPRVVACDLHPQLHTTRLAERWSREQGLELVRVQHHYAHAAALMGEARVERMVAISCDGVGYGPDGTIWGGEVLYCDGATYERMGHLEPQPMPGGDLATRYPLRMTASILRASIDVGRFLAERADQLPGGRREVEVILRQIEKPAMWTTSTGRVLDAVAALLEVCFERTYEGEPAMRLEGLAYGAGAVKMEPVIKGRVLKTTPLLEELYAQLGRISPRVLAATAQEYLAKGLAEVALEVARDKGVKDLGFTGGVAYNEAMARTIRRLVEREGFKLHLHRQVPPGDGGLSFGQVVAVLLRKREISSDGG